MTLPPVIQGHEAAQRARAVAIRYGLPPTLLIGLGKAESTLTSNAERWGRHSEMAKHALAQGDRAGLLQILKLISDIGSHDISFGWTQQTWRWSDEYNGKPYDLDSILIFREKYFNFDFAAEVAAKRIKPYYERHKSEHKALAMYNNPAGNGAFKSLDHEKAYSGALLWAENWVRDHPLALEPVPMPSPNPPSTPVVAEPIVTDAPQFVMGFGELAAALGPDVVGQPMRNEVHPIPGVMSIQESTKGYFQWVNGGPAIFVPGKTLYDAPSVPSAPPLRKPELFTNRGTVAGRYAATPLGTILHGSRSGSTTNTLAQEFRGTANWAKSNPDGLCWSITCGPNAIFEHLELDSWGWNAGAPASSQYLAVEFAQPLTSSPIVDEQIEAFCWWWVNLARKAWPNLPPEFPNHSDLPQGQQQGKSDVEKRGEHTVRDRILARLRAVGAI